ncbi:MAG: ferrous iron transport protein A [Erysipelotrichaceae bacterium]|nr:ferrous iron transport protein A [Erysipelotrichaceae bacterium]
MPIFLAPIDREVTIRHVGCEPKESARLAALGLCKDTKVTVLSSQHGAVVVLIRGSRLALDRVTASKIIVA